MDTVPLEVIQHIFALACTDGGATGCALAQTSCGVRAAARSTRFRSVALRASAHRLRAFLDVYRQENEGSVGAEGRERGRARVAHLYVALLRGEGGEAGYWEDVRTLFKAVAPHLETLAIEGEGGGKDAPLAAAGVEDGTRLVAGPFPALRDLTFAGLSQPGCTASALLLDDLGGRAFPAVERIQLVFPTTLPSFATLARHTPRVKELRAFNLDAVPGTLDLLWALGDTLDPRGAAREVCSADVLGLGKARGERLRESKAGREEDDAARGGATWAALRYVALQPCAPPERKPDTARVPSAALEAHTELWRALRRIERAAEGREGTEFSILDARQTEGEWVREAWGRVVEGEHREWERVLESGRKTEAGGAGWRYTTVLHPI